MESCVKHQERRARPPNARMVQLPALRGLFLICTSDKQIFIRDRGNHHPWQTNTYRIQPHWRKLPPVDALVVPLDTGTNMVASSGMVYAWSNEDGLKFLLKLDMGRAEWTWKKLPEPYPFDFEAISFNGKIYAPLTDSPRQKHGVLVLDMMTDKCKPVETWTQENMRVLLKKGRKSNVSVEEMYCSVGDELDPNVEALKYDVESNSWRTLEQVPEPAMPWRFRFHIQVLNSDCFEPAPERGINIIWVNHDCESFFWFNSSVEKAWVEISYNPVMEERRHLHCLNFIHGSIYRMPFEEDEDRGGILSPYRITIMKGRVIVASKSVAWEEVHEIGFFHKFASTHWYTIMA